MAYPDFIGIGAQKAGTTWLSQNLQVHPEIWMPPVKEIHYFDQLTDDRASAPRRLFDRLTSDRAADQRWRQQVRTRSVRHLRKFSWEEVLWDLRYYAGTPSDRWYASLFEPGTGRVAGEITPSYSTLDLDTISRVHRLMPHARIIFMMRNPIERAWSQVVMHFGRSDRGSAARAREERLIKSFKREGSRLRTDYRRTLENWGSFYPEDRIFVGFLEDIHFFPEEFLRRVHAFLGVDTSFIPPQVRHRVHSRSAATMPTNVAVHLARIYRKEIPWLAERFGGYASFWSFCAERLAEDPPEEESLPYPLYESYLWEEWSSEAEDSRRPPQLQSAPLPLV